MLNNIPEKEETTTGVHAILTTPDGKVILQQRDSNPHIVNPGKISMFGGTIKKTDSLKKALRRELLEELEFDLKNHSLSKLGTYEKKKDIDGIDYTIHVYVICQVPVFSDTMSASRNFCLKATGDIFNLV